MTTLNPRPPYNAEEIARLYPNGIKLELVQIVFRHGERTPVRPRFTDSIPVYWAQCQAAERFRAAVFEHSGQWGTLPFKRSIETSGAHGKAVKALGPRGESDGLCVLGELTARGRETTLKLGERIRHLYVDQIGFLPAKLDPSHLYLRSTSLTRTLESLQELVSGLYPSDTRTENYQPNIVTRLIFEDNLLPNEGACPRLAQLMRRFAEIAAEEYDPKLEYASRELAKEVPDGVKINGHPSVSGILDTMNSCLAHNVRLPKGLYNARVQRDLEQAAVTEWFGGYRATEEYGRLAVGRFMGDILDRMDDTRRQKSNDRMKIALYGSHDTQLAGMLASLNVFDDRWPMYTSSIAFELFSRPSKSALGAFWKGSDYFVRMKYNDKPLALPACAASGKHMESDGSLCTLDAFRNAIEKLRPRNWDQECRVLAD